MTADLNLESAVEYGALLEQKQQDEYKLVFQYNFKMAQLAIA